MWYTWLYSVIKDASKPVVSSLPFNTSIDGLLLKVWMSGGILRLGWESRWCALWLRVIGFLFLALPEYTPLTVLHISRGSMVLPAGPWALLTWSHCSWFHSVSLYVVLHNPGSPQVPSILQLFNYWPAPPPPPPPPPSYFNPFMPGDHLGECCLDLWYFWK